MPLYALGDAEPDIHPDAYVHPDAVVIGNVTIGAESSVWPTAVLRGDDGCDRGRGAHEHPGRLDHPHHGRPADDHRRRGDRRAQRAHRERDDRRPRADLVRLGGAERSRPSGAGAIVGAGAVVSPNAEIPPRAMALGVPARVREGYEVPEEVYAYAVTSYVERGRRFRAELRRLG